MLYMIFCRDFPDSGHVRDKHYQAHRAFIRRSSEADVKVVMSGPLLDKEDGEPVGSLFLVEASDRNAAAKFNQTDPFYQAKVWEQITILAFDKKLG